MTTHTPGPWRYYTKPQPNGCPIVGNSRGLMVAMLAHSVDCKHQRDEAESNARLISAAPELLAHLKNAVHCLVYGVGEFDFDAALAAIAKAEGKS